MPKVQWQLGTVRWFDPVKGEGYIRDQNDNSLYFHYSAIQSSKKFKTLKDNAKVKFKVHEDITFRQISEVKAV